VLDGDAYCLRSYRKEPITFGGPRSIVGGCGATPTDPDCLTWDQREKPMKLCLPAPTFENPLGELLEKPRLINCYEKVGDWMFEPGAEELCDTYKYGESEELIIGDNLTQFDGKHCWSEYYEVAFLCECREGLESVFEKIHDEPENGSRQVNVDYPQNRCNKSSKGFSIENKELKQCWYILGDQIFEPGNELICYYVNFGLGMTPPKPPPYHIPKPTFTDPRGQALTDPDQKRCYKNLGDWMFVPGNELLCCFTDNGENVVFTSCTQLGCGGGDDGKKPCFSFDYEFAFDCDYRENLTQIGFPNLTAEENQTRECETTDVVPEKSPNSPGHKLTDPDLIHCWEILGDIIFLESHKYDCFYICFGKGLIPNEPPPPAW